MHCSLERIFEKLFPSFAFSSTKHSQITGQQQKREASSSQPPPLLHKHLDISQEITTESSLLHLLTQDPYSNLSASC